MKPFDTIESAQEFIDLLVAAVEESQRDVESEIGFAQVSEDERRLQALRLVALNLDKLALQMTKSRRVLSDLRMLRRLLLGERNEPGPAKFREAGVS